LVENSCGVDWGNWEAWSKDVNVGDVDGDVEGGVVVGSWVDGVVGVIIGEGVV